MSEVINVADLEQGSPEWYQARAGSLGASDISDVMRRIKSGAYGASRANLAAKLVAERVTGQPYEGFQSQAMAWGKDTQDAALKAIAFRLDVKPVKVGLVRHPRIAFAHASPDALIGDDIVVEIKCPNTATHLDYLLGDKDIDPDYVKQVQWQLACTDRAYAIWASFDPRLPERMRLAHRLLPRDEAVIAALEDEATSFLNEVALRVDQLQERFPE